MLLFSGSIWPGNMTQEECHCWELSGLLICGTWGWCLDPHYQHQHATRFLQGLALGRVHHQESRGIKRPWQTIFHWANRQCVWTPNLNTSTQTLPGAACTDPNIKCVTVFRSQSQTLSTFVLWVGRPVDVNEKAAMVCNKIRPLKFSRCSCRAPHHVRTPLNNHSYQWAREEFDICQHSVFHVCVQSYMDGIDIICLEFIDAWCSNCGLGSAHLFRSWQCLHGWAGSCIRDGKPENKYWHYFYNIVLACSDQLFNRSTSMQIQKELSTQRMGFEKEVGCPLLFFAI